MADMGLGAGGAKLLCFGLHREALPTTSGGEESELQQWISHARFWCISCLRLAHKKRRASA